MAPNQIITQARERLGLNPQELGEAIGISHTWDLEDYEDDLSLTLSLAELNRLCEVLNLTPYELFEQLPPEHTISPSDLRDAVIEDCHRRGWTIEKFGDEVGWEMQGLIENPAEYLSELNLDGLQDICRQLNVNPLAAIPFPMTALIIPNLIATPPF